MAKNNSNEHQQTHNNHNTHFEGFDIPIKPEHKSRIDRLVNNYEAHIVTHVNEEYLNTTKWSDRLADKLASFGGSWTFISIFAVFLVAWMLLNTIFMLRPFDRPPFILLNLILSFIAAFQAPIILMSQNRQSERDKNEAVIDFAINYKAEQEIDDMQSHLHRMEAQLAEMREILEKLSEKAGNN